MTHNNVSNKVHFSETLSIFPLLCEMFWKVDFYFQLCILFLVEVVQYHGPFCTTIFYLHCFVAPCIYTQGCSNAALQYIFELFHKYSPTNRFYLGFSFIVKEVINKQPSSWEVEVLHHNIEPYKRTVVLISMLIIDWLLVQASSRPEEIYFIC